MAKNSPSRFYDFWLLGGASIVAWVIFALAQLMRGSSGIVEQRVQQVAPTFALMALLFNHPHFMASYRMAYSRDRSFHKKNWFALWLVPLLLAGLFIFSYFSFQTTDFSQPWIRGSNAVFAFLGLSYQWGETANLGTDLLGASVWLMYLTVGWHYSKQVFGCAMVYANYDAYPLSKNQRLMLKLSVFSVAFYSFCYLSMHWRNYSPLTTSFSFLNFPVTELGLPLYFDWLANVAVVMGLVLFLYGVVFRNYQTHKKLPSWNFLIPVIAFYIWWVPLFPQKEYYLMLVPFFHSLQYLVFALRMENANVEKNKNPQISFAFRMLVLLLVGFLSFEFIPAYFDMRFSDGLSITVFFTAAVAVFINVHHFFIDSVLWRFQDGDMRQVILSATDSRRI